MKTVHVHEHVHVYVDVDVDVDVDVLVDVDVYVDVDVDGAFPKNLRNWSAVSSPRTVHIAGFVDSPASVCYLSGFTGADMTALPLRAPTREESLVYEKLQIIAHGKTHRKVLDIFSRFDRRGSLLDIPAGEGALAWQLSKLGYKVTGGDVDPGFFKVRAIRCIYMDMNRRFPIDEAQFDFVSCIEGIEHVQDQFHFVRECGRILKPGGHLIISTPNILNLASRLKFLLSGFFSLFSRPINEFSQVPVFDHIHPVTYYQLRYMLHTQGFHITQVATDLRRRSAAALYALKPLVQLYTIRTMRKETDSSQRAANREIRSVLTSPEVLLGRTLIVVARKTGGNSIRIIQASEV